MEKTVYYISKLLKGLDLRYFTTKNICLSLAFAVSKFHHLCLGHRVHLVTKSNIVKYLQSYPQLLRRLAQWAVLTSCNDVKCVRTAAIKGQVVADLWPTSLGPVIFHSPNKGF